MADFIAQQGQNLLCNVILLTVIFAALSVAAGR